MTFVYCEQFSVRHAVYGSFEAGHARCVDSEFCNGLLFYSMLGGKTVVCSCPADWITIGSSGDAGLTLLQCNQLACAIRPELEPTRASHRQTWCFSASRALFKLHHMWALCWLRSQGAELVGWWWEFLLVLVVRGQHEDRQDSKTGRQFS